MSQAVYFFSTFLYSYHIRMKKSLHGSYLFLGREITEKGGYIILLVPKDYAPTTFLNCCINHSFCSAIEMLLLSNSIASSAFLSGDTLRCESI